MRVNRARAFSILAGIALLWGTSHAQLANPPISDKELIVATKESAPFVMKRPDGTLHGISIDLWRRTADRLHLRYRFSEQPTVKALMAGTAEGSFDAAIAALTVTAARDRIVDFTQPFYSTESGRLCRCVHRGDQLAKRRARLRRIASVSLYSPAAHQAG